MDTQKLYESWSTKKTPEKLTALVDGFKTDIDQAIFRSGGEVSPITRGIGKQVVIHAAHTYKPGEKTQFSSWVNTQLQRLNRSLREQKNVTRLSEHTAKQLFDVQTAITALESETGFPPTDSDIADHLGMPVRQINKLRQRLFPETVSEDVEVDDDSGDRWVQDMVYYSLPPRDQFIMQHGLGYNGTKIIPGKTIASRLKISPAAVSQRLGKIQEMLTQAEASV